MAQKKRQANLKKPALKPELVLVAHSAKTAVAAKPKKSPKKQKKHIRKKNSIAKYFKLRIKQRTFALIVASVAIVAIVIVWLTASQAVLQANKMFDSAQSVAGSAYEAVKQEAELVKIIGNNDQRAREIVNYQSAPAELQKFIMADYRQFKKLCIANGVLSDDVGYELSGVIYDSYAVAKRSCNGTETVIFKNFNKNWALVFSGNIDPPCTLVNDLEIPQGAAMYCAQDGVRYVNANP